MFAINRFFRYANQYHWVLQTLLPLSGTRHVSQRIYVICSTWWRHQMGTFSALLALCVGNSTVTGEFPTQRPVTRSFDVSFDLRLNKHFSHEIWSICASIERWHHNDNKIGVQFLKVCPGCRIAINVTEVYWTYLFGLILHKISISRTFGRFLQQT